MNFTYQHRKRNEILEGVAECINELNSLNLCHGRLTLNNITVHEESYNEFYKLKNYGMNIVSHIDDLNYDDYTFLAPEVILGKEYNIEADVWSFGCLFYTLITGRRLFHSASIRGLVSKISKCDYSISPNECSEKEKRFIELTVKKNSKERLEPTKIMEELEKLKVEKFEADSDDITIDYIKQMAEHNVPITDYKRLAVIGQTKDLLEEVINLFNGIEDENNSVKRYLLFLLINMSLLPIYYDNIVKLIKLNDDSESQILFNSVETITSKKNNDGTQYISPATITLNCKEKEGGLKLLKVFCNGLPSCSNLQALEVSSNDIADPILKYIGASLDWEKLRKLREINLKGNQISHSAMKIFCDYLIPRPSKVNPGEKPEPTYIDELKTLYLEMNNIGDSGVQYITSRFPVLINLEELLLGNNAITDIGLHSISKNLKYLIHLTKLTIGCNSQISNNGVINLLNHLHHCPYINTLFLNGQSLNDDVIDCLTEHLVSRVNAFLSYLILNNNNITDNGAMKLIKCLGDSRQKSCCDRLAILDLNQNKITKKEDIMNFFEDGKAWYQLTI